MNIKTFSFHQIMHTDPELQIIVLGLEVTKPLSFFRYFWCPICDYDVFQGITRFLESGAMRFPVSPFAWDPSQGVNEQLGIYSWNGKSPSKCNGCELCTKNRESGRRHGRQGKSNWTIFSLNSYQNATPSITEICHNITWENTSHILKPKKNMISLIMSWDTKTGSQKILLKLHR